MGLTIAERSRIAESVRDTLTRRGMTAAEAAKLSGIHPSRLSRIMRGDFSTANPTVMQICNFLGIDPYDRASSDAGRICASALQIWNGSASDADEVVKLLEQLAALRRR